jgi:hypothetical protein
MKNGYKEIGFGFISYLCNTFGFLQVNVHLLAREIHP